MPAPIPLISTVAATFWSGLAEGIIRAQHCPECDSWIHYPRAFCPGCGARELQWRDVAGAGTLHSFAVANVPTSPDFSDQVPQVLAIVELDCGIRLATTIVDASADRLAVGAAVEAVFDDATFEGLSVLRFRLRD